MRKPNTSFNFLSFPFFSFWLLLLLLLQISNLVLLLLGIAMGLYALSTYSDFKKLKHENDHNVTMLTMASTVVEQTLKSEGEGGLSLSHLSLSDGPNNHLNFLNTTKVPIYITGLGKQASKPLLCSLRELSKARLQPRKEAPPPSLFLLLPSHTHTHSLSLARKKTRACPLFALTDSYHMLISTQKQKRTPD